jgi:signal transduction histidine kinase
MDDKTIKQSIEILSHKLKNPVHGALLNLEVLKKILENDKADKKAFKHLSIVQKEVERVHAIVNKFQDYMQKDNPARIDLKKYLDQG